MFLQHQHFLHYWKSSHSKSKLDPFWFLILCVHIFVLPTTPLVPAQPQTLEIFLKRPTTGFCWLYYILYLQFLTLCSNHSSADIKSWPLDCNSDPWLHFYLLSFSLSDINIIAISNLFDSDSFCKISKMSEGFSFLQDKEIFNKNLLITFWLEKFVTGIYYQPQVKTSK